MKINTKIALISFILLILCIPNQFAQEEMDAYSWDSYSMAFSIPQTFTVLESDSIKFSAGNSAMNLTIYPVNASGIDSSNMESLLGEWASSNGVEILSDFERFNDAENYFGVLCAGKLTDYNVMLIIAIDPYLTDTGFYIWISYNDDSYETALSIISSFYPI
jgi:hypothetical protein